MSDETLGTIIGLAIFLPFAGVLLFGAIGESLNSWRYKRQWSKFIQRELEKEGRQ